MLFARLATATDYLQKESDSSCHSICSERCNQRPDFEKPLNAAITSAKTTRTQHVTFTSSQTTHPASPAMQPLHTDCSRSNTKSTCKTKTLSNASQMERPSHQPPTTLTILRLDFLPFPAAITTIASALCEHFICVPAPVEEARVVNLQQWAVVVHRRESWAIAQDHVVPASASVSTLARAETRIS